MRLLAEVRAQHEDFAISRALDAIWKVVADANRYFAGQEPWALKKTDPARMETVLYVTAEVLRIVGILIQPYVPQSAAKLLDLLGVSARRLYGLAEAAGFGRGAARASADFPALCGGGGSPGKELSFLVVDSHCHLDYEGLTERLPEVLANAEAAGVGLMVSIGTRVRKFERLLRIAEDNANVFCTVGTHPHHAHEELDVTVARACGARQASQGGGHRRGGAGLSL